MLTITELNTFTCVTAWYIPHSGFTWFVASPDAEVGSTLMANLYVDRIFTDRHLPASWRTMWMSPVLLLGIFSMMIVHVIVRLY